MSLLDVFDLGKGFQQHFRIDEARDDTLQDIVFRIRHDVYCVDLGFEPARPDGRETDAYDRHSQHCLLRTVKAPHYPIGCTRIVRPDPDDLNKLLPFERTCANAIDRSLIDPSRMDRTRIAEVSRLAVRSVYRRRKGEKDMPAPFVDEHEGSQSMPRFPYIPVSLYMGSIALARQAGVHTLFVLTEPRLASHFARLGVRIQQIGAPIEHRGQRVPSMIDVEEVVRTMHRMMRPLWKVVSSQVLRDSAMTKKGNAVA